MISRTNTQRHAEPVKQVISILIVDDDRLMRNSLRDLLEVYDMNCTLAEDGQQALTHLSNNPFDLVLLDIKMPIINGLQVMNEIHDSYAGTDVIILSGEASFENSRTAFRLGADDFLKKPYNSSELIDLIHKISEKRHLKPKKTSELHNSKLQDSVEQTLMELEDIIHNEDQTFTNEIINSSPAIAFLWKNTANWPVQFVSENVVDLLGYTATEFITGEIVYTDLIHEEDLDRVIKEIVTDNTIKKFKHKPYRMITKSGVIIWIDDFSSVVRDNQGNISHYQGIIINVSERELANKKILKKQLYLQHAAHHDALTGLPNRLLLMDRMQQAIKNARRATEYLAILFIDLDKFKLINDTLGHEAGDKVLKTVAERLILTVRTVDTVARIGGDEFIVLMENISSIKDVKSIVHRMNHSLNQSVHWESHQLCISSSIGISLFPDDGDTAEKLIKKADIAMYQSKVKEGNTFQFSQYNK